MDKVVTIVDVARKANVSVGTVSRVFNSHANVNAKLKQQVLKTANELGYKLKEQAPNNKSAFSGNFGIILEERLAEHSYWTQKIVYDLVRSLSQYGHQCQLVFSGSDNDTPPEIVRRMDGCIIWGAFGEKFYENLENICNIPVVSYSKEIPYARGVSVEVFNKESMAQAVEHLLALGHTRIALVMNASPIKTANERLEGFLTTQEDCGIKPDRRLIRLLEDKVDTQDQEPQTEPVFAAVQALLDLNDHPTAFVFGSDQIAIGGMETIRENGYRIPGDISVVGFDNQEVAGYLYPGLTTMGLDTKELAGTMISALEKLIAGRPVEKRLLLNRRLVRRKSTGRLPTDSNKEKTAH